jgi:simple sugar transport system ATP-binding protein
MSRDPRELAIDVTGVAKAYGSTQALAGVELKVGIGESRALLGRNGAGKSTLIGVLTGLVHPDAGSVRVRGVVGGPTEHAGAEPIACVYQKTTLVPGLTAAENIMLGHYPTRAYGAVDWPRMRRRGRDLLEEWGLGRVVDSPVDQLEPLERKVVEICRALARGPRILLLDEPTAGLDEHACAELFQHIAAARGRGVTLLYVSHHLEEIFEVCDGVTILRDGTDVLTADIADLTIPRIVDVMVGETEHRVTGSAASSRSRPDRDEQREVLEVVGLHLGAQLRGVDLRVRAGECVGVTGLDGAGHVQLAAAIAGMARPSSGSIKVAGRSVPRGDVAAAIRAGIGFVPENRHDSGFVPGLSVEENATLTVLDRLRGRLGFINGRRRAELYRALSRTWSIKASGPHQPVEELSGGNQQKVVLARALASDPDVVVLINPTAGVDVAATESIYRSLAELREAGRAVVIVSTNDADLAICERIVVMFKGRIHAELEAGWAERTLVAAIQGAPL